MSENIDIIDLSRLVAKLKANGNLGKAQKAFAIEMNEKIHNIVADMLDFDVPFSVNIKKLDVTNAQLVIEIKFEPITDFIELAEDDGEDESLFDDIERIFKKFVND